MIHGYHVIFSTYGFWLPNDPRGSWSQFVGSWELLRFGRATKTDSRRSVAAAPHDWERREAAKRLLRYPPVAFTGAQALAVARGFRQALLDARYLLHACSILPEHVHLVVARHPRDIGRIVGHLKARATQALYAGGLWPADRRPVWGRKDWNVFLASPQAMHRAIRYVEGNPQREGKPRQRWSFVTPYRPAHAPSKLGG